MDRDTIIEVTQKLTGWCFPYGDTRIDEERYESLLLKIAVASSLIDEVYEAGKLFERHEYSIQNISNRANQYLTELRDTLCEIDYLPPIGLIEEEETSTISEETSTVSENESVAESATTTDCISRQQAIEAVVNEWKGGFPQTNFLRTQGFHDWLKRILDNLPPVEDMGEVSDGYHTFNQLYHQRAVLFATIVNQNKDNAWKSWKHEDGKFCFDKEGEWFIVGVDTPEGSYTYHYEKKYWDLFDCKELDRGKHWDGHTEDDVVRLLSLPPETHGVCSDCISRKDAIEALEHIHIPTQAQREYAREIFDNLPPVTPTERTGEWVKSAIPNELYVCSECGGACWSYDYERNIVKSNYCPNCGADMRGNKE